MFSLICVAAVTLTACEEYPYYGRLRLPLMVATATAAATATPTAATANPRAATATLRWVWLLAAMGTTAATATAAMVVIIAHITTAMVDILMPGPVGAIGGAGGDGVGRALSRPIASRLGSRAVNKRRLYAPSHC